MQGGEGWGRGCLNSSFFLLYFITDLIRRSRARACFGKYKILFYIFIIYIYFIYLSVVDTITLPLLFFFGTLSGLVGWLVWCLGRFGSVVDGRWLVGCLVGYPLL